MSENLVENLHVQLEREYDTVIIGGGAAGLSAAYTLARKGLSVLVLEANNYPGGRIRTIHYPDAYAEAGALVITEEEPETLQLLKDLNRDSFIELGLHGAEIFFGKRFTHLTRVDAGFKNPSDIASLFRLLRAGLADRGKTLPLPGPKLYIAYRRALREMRKMSRNISFPYKPYEIEEADRISFGEFLDRFHPDLRAYVDLQLKVTAGALSDEISLYWGLVTFHWNVDGKFYFLRGGTSVLPEAVASFLDGRVILEAEAVSVEDSSADVTIEFKLPSGETHSVKSSSVVMAAPPSAVLKTVKNLDEKKIKALSAMRFGAYIPVHIYCRSRFWEDHIKTGYLNCAGLVFADLVDGTRGQDGTTGILNAFIGGPEASRLIDAAEEDIIAEVLRDINIVFPGSENEIIETRVFKWKEAIPYLDPKTEHRLDDLREPQGRIYFCGDYTQGAGINDAVFSGLAAAEQILSGL